MLRTFVLASDDGIGGDVRDANGGFGLVDVLPARATGSVDVDAQIGFVDFNVDVLCFGQDGDGACRRMDAALAFGCRDALNAVRAGFELEMCVDVGAANHGDDFFVAAGGALTF